MTIIIFMFFALFVTMMEMVSERHYISRFFNKAKEIYAFTYACILCFTGNA